MSGHGKVRVGVVGAGAMGECHARAYSELRETRLVGVYDIDTSRAIQVVRNHGGNAFSSLQDLFRSVDAVTIASPTTSHAEIALDAIDCGLHVLVENPLAAGLEESQEVVDLANRRRDQVVMVGQLERFNPAVIVLKEQLARSPIVSVTMRRMSPFSNRALDTDVVHDLMIHDIDLALDLLGDDVETIDAIGSPVRTAFVDQAMAQFTMHGGAEVHLIASRVANRTVRSIEVRTPEGRIVADLLRRAIEVRAEPGRRNGRRCHVHQVPVAETDPLADELQQFVDCILGRAEVQSDVNAGYRAIAFGASINALIDRTASVTLDAPTILQVGD